MLKYIFWGIILYMLIRFVFTFLIPVIRTGRRMSKQMREFQNAMNQGQPGTQTSQSNTPPKQENRTRTGDYIDFEEIKE
jgi:hypothetical protein